MNCGAAGTCSVAVKGKDDTTPNACQAMSTCDAGGVCQARWSLVKSIPVTSYTYYQAALGSKLYIAGASNFGGMTQFFKSFDVTSGLVQDEQLANNDLVAAGYTSVLVPAGNSLFYMANNATYLTPGNATWSSFSAYPDGPKNGEVATVAVGNTIWRVGGRGGTKGVYTYTFTDGAPGAGTWSATGTYADHPSGIDQGCAAAYNGKLYVFGGTGAPVPTTTTTVYTIATNTWTTLPAASDFPGSCRSVGVGQGYVWRGKIVVADSTAVRIFDPTTHLWSSEPSPMSSLFFATALVPSDGNLYYVGDDDPNAAALIYKWVLN